MIKLFTMPVGRAVLGWANRLLTVSIFALLLILLMISAILNLAGDRLVGETSPGAYDDVGVGRELEGSVPNGKQMSPSADPMVALTFDDGPDAEQTPRVLDILAEHDVKATFFLIGEKIPEHVGLVQRMVEEGHEVGLHSYNHSRMGDLEDEEVVRQYQMNQELLVGALGREPLLARPPYSFTATHLPSDEFHAARVAQEELGLVMVFSDLAPPDFTGISAEQIAARSIPDPGMNAILTLHDRPANTTSALSLLIPELKERGYRFVTVSEYGDVPAWAEPGLEERLTGRALLDNARFSSFLESFLEPLLILIAPLLAVRFFSIIYLAWSQNRRHQKRRRQPVVGWPGVSLIVPAYNEEVGIEDALASFAKLEFDGPMEILVVDDGSTDRTAELASQVPGVRVLSKPNGGKASALNAGIRAATFEICVLVDGDTVFDANTISEIVKPFEDPYVGAVSGYPRVGNRDNFLAELQNVEYIMGCSLIRRAQERLGMISCLPGAIGAFRRSALIDVGGVPEHTLAEDTDLTVTLGSRGWKLAYTPEASAWTEVPIDIKTFWKQRVRWAYGVCQVLWKHRSANEQETNKRYRWSVMAYTGFDLVLAVVTPASDLIALQALFSGRLSVFVGLVGLTLLAQILTVGYAVYLDKDRFRSLLYVPAQIVFFRYFNALVVLSALWSAVTGRQEKWNKPKRVGLSPGSNAGGRSGASKQELESRPPAMSTIAKNG